MPTSFNGNGSLVTPAVANGVLVAIASSTNASPIVVATPTSHGFFTGDSIEIEGHLVNTAANGFWQITKVDATHFSLNGTTGNGVGGATGYAADFELQPAYQIPSNGEAADMGTLGAALEGLSNTAPFLYRAAGRQRLNNFYKFLLNGSAPFAAWASMSVPGAAASWVPITGAIDLIPFLGTPVPVGSGSDHFFVSCSGTVNLLATSTCNSALSMGYATQSTGGTYTQFGPTAQFALTTSGQNFPFSFSDVFAGSFGSGGFNFGLMIYGNPQAITLQLTGGASLTAFQYKSN